MACSESAHGAPLERKIESLNRKGKFNGFLIGCNLGDYNPSCSVLLTFDNLNPSPFRLTPKDGFVEVPTTPGLGIELDMDGVKQYRVE